MNAGNANRAFGKEVLVTTLLIKHGTIVTAADQYKGDLFIVDEQIRTIGKDLTVTADRTLDAAGCYVIPGGIDPHVHMQIPFMGTHSSDTFETGTLAALHGGTTTIIDFALQTQGDTLHNAFNQWYEWAEGHAVGDYAFHVAVTDLNPKTKPEVAELIAKRGVTSFKTFMAYKGALMIDDRQMVELMRELKTHGALLTVHCEHGDLVDNLIAANRAAGNAAPRYHCLSRPAIAEGEATGRVIDLGHAVGQDVYIVHLTCEEALGRARRAGSRNQKVHVETCIQYLTLDESRYFQEGFEGAKYVMSPPLRKPKDQEALWAGLRQGLVHVVGTDHCPFTMEQKRMGERDFSKIPNGHPAVEHRLELLYSEGVAKDRISLNRFVEVTSTAPARLFGLWPRKGCIAPGSDADLVIFDPKQEHTLSAKTHHMNVDYSAYEGWKVTGKCRTTVLRGKVVVDDGTATVEKGYGTYLSRNRYRPVI
ncbi:MAG: dihydropyrimidinase [Deltaproteobacteria bacterium]|nr:dihydropyrimidinase [Deltaproteobacteria bacterium]